jgi:HTH-type transcriptional regulator, sugar sensing transcriptional regulator
MEKIIEYLKQLELSEVEAKLYLTLLQTGPITVRELAANIDIKRTTAYLYVDQLVERGLILKLVKGSKKLVSADDPKNLQQLVEEKVKHAEEVKQHFPDILKQISTTVPHITDSSEAEIKYYKGKNGVKKIYEDALKTKEIRSYVNLEAIRSIFPENFQLFDNAIKLNPEIKMLEIVEDSPLSRKRIENAKQNNNFFYKIMPENMKLTAQDILIYDGKVCIINLKDDVHGVVLQNADFYNNLKTLFDLNWEILP